jgi:hypothetical protein
MLTERIAIQRGDFGLELPMDNRCGRPPCAPDRSSDFFSNHLTLHLHVAENASRTNGPPRDGATSPAPDELDAGNELVSDLTSW